MTGRRRRLDRKPMNIQPAGGPATWRRKPLAAAVSVLAFVDSPVAIGFFMALAGITGGAGATVLSTVWAELYGVLNLGSIRALVAGLSVIFSSLAPAVLGWLIDAGVSLELISALCGVYAAAGSLLLALIFRPGAMRQRAPGA